MANRKRADVGAGRTETGGSPPDPTTEYDLKIDAQVEKFLELKHKLTFFLITAAVGSIGYTLKFSIDKLTEIAGHPGRTICLLAATLVGLLAVVFALFS